MAKEVGTKAIQIGTAALVPAKKGVWATLFIIPRHAPCVSPAPLAWRPRSRPRDVLAGARIDLDHLALLHEQRHAHHRAGFQGRRFADETAFE